MKKLVLLELISNSADPKLRIWAIRIILQNDMVVLPCCLKFVNMKSLIKEKVPFCSNKIRSILVVFLSTYLVACGGGGGSDNSVTAFDDVLTGRFLDSAVAGLTYRTETITGTTNANGEFSYLAGETVVFGLGDLEFPAVTAAQILTPLELAGVTDINDTGVANMARLLQSLDQDCDPSNGINISGQALLAAAGMSIDFESPNFDTEVVNLVANGGQQSSSCQVIIGKSQALAHLQQTLDSLNDQTTPPIGGGLAGKAGIWNGEGQQSSPMMSWTISINIQANETTIEYPSLNCGGTLALLEESEARLVFRETITFASGIQCVDQGFVELTDQSENELVFRWYYADNNNEQGVLGAVGSVTKIQ